MCAKIYDIKTGEEKKPYHGLIDKSLKKHSHAEEAVRITENYSLQAHAAAKAKLKEKHGKLDLNSKEAQEDFAEFFADELYKQSEPELYKRLGTKIPKNLDKARAKMSEEEKLDDAVFRDNILEAYHGINFDSIKKLAKQYKNRFIEGFKEEYADRHLANVRGRYTSMAHKHLRDAKLSERKAIVKEIDGLENILDETGIQMLHLKENASLLGSILHRHNEKGLSKDYLENTQLAEYLIKEETQTSKKTGTHN